MDTAVYDPSTHEPSAPQQMDLTAYFHKDNNTPSIEGIQEIQNAGYASEDICNWICQETGIPFYPLIQPHPLEDIIHFITECDPQLSFGPLSELPWLPLTMLGPIPVLGHFHPFATDLFGFRKDICFQVILTPEDYMATLTRAAELVPENRLRTMPNATAERPHGAETPEQLYQWLQKRQYATTQTLNTPWEESTKNNPILEWALQMLIENRRVIPFQSLSLSEESLGALPQAMMEKYQMVCYHKTADVYYIASANTSLTRTRLTGEINARITSKTGKIGVVCSMTHSTFIEGAIRYLMTGGIGGEKTNTGLMGETGRQQKTDTFRIDFDPSYSRPLEEGMEPPEVLRWVLFRAINMKASDIHIQEGEEIGTIRMRINGALSSVANTSLEYVRKVISLIKLSSDLNVAEKRMPQDGRFSIEVKGDTVDARVSTVPVMTASAGESCVIRLINKQSSLKSVGELELPARQVSIVRSVLERKSGLILVTGPTGSGKTSTLYAFLNEINRPDVAIVTIEDPVEIVLPGAKQLQVNTAIDLSFSRLLRSVLRHDPDIVMVGEIRDKETSDHAIQAAQTGHLVFATLHTNDALRAIPRLEALGTDRNQLANSLLMVQAQRLVRTLCRNCRKPRRISEREHETILRHLPQEGGRGPEFQEFLDEWNEMIERAVNGISPVHDAGSCIHCNHTGYSRRRAVMEVFPIDDHVRDMIENGAKVGALTQYMAKQGFTDLSMESLRLFLRGETSFDEIRGYMKI